MMDFDAAGVAVYSLSYDEADALNDFPSILRLRSRRADYSPRATIRAKPPRD